jgi:hypothetical protein
VKTVLVRFIGLFGSSEEGFDLILVHKPDLLTALLEITNCSSTDEDELMILGSSLVGK